MLSGCLVEDPPAYVAAKQTRPRLDTTGATPPIDQIVSRSTGDAIQFRMPVSSEDAGEEIWGLFFRDEVTPGTYLAREQLQPSTLEAEDRPDLTFEWRVPAGIDGCHRIILNVTHASNVEVFEVVRPDDLAAAIWWLNINPNPDDPNTLVNCPSASAGGP